MKSEHFVSICRHLLINPDATQRELAVAAGFSLGLINTVINECINLGYLEFKPENTSQNKNKKLILTKSGKEHLETFKVTNAIILAAGFGSRFVPLTYEKPKGLLSVYGEPMIERQIKQLHEKGITDITIVVGYKKESFDYLIDRYGVSLVFNPEYAVKNNLSSLKVAVDKLKSTYLLMSDFWIEDNIFNTYEARSWYSTVYEAGEVNEWCVSTKKSGKIKKITIGGSDALTLIGPAYLTPSFSELFRGLVYEYYNRRGTDDYYWEHILLDHLKDLEIYANIQTGNVHEFENLEELRLFDHSYNNASNSKIMKTIASIFNVSEDMIQDIKPIKIGMTNYSFTFVGDDTKYIMRIPGEGTDKLINREQEYMAYKLIEGLGICDDVVYIGRETGYKITKNIENARVCDPLNMKDVKACMKKLKEFHAMKLQVPFSFDIFERIEYYESLWLRNESCFQDYEQTKDNIMSLKSFIEQAEKEWGFTHIDAVPDNFMFVPGEEIQLIDWEYASMQDQHVDIAMFAVYAMYDREQVEKLIDSYFEKGCSDETRTKIYAYIAMCGMLWSNWCEYKSDFGVEFGEYSLRQYRFAKDYYKIFKEKTRGK